MFSTLKNTDFNYDVFSYSSEELFTRAKSLIPGGVNSPLRAFKSVGGHPFFVKEGQGAILKTVDGQTLIDCVCSMGPAIHGHNHPYIKSAIEHTLKNGIGFWMPHPIEVQMAQTIHRLVPCAEKIRFCNSGTEATLTAIRLARGYTQRKKIIKFTGAYHGHVDALLVKAGSGASCLSCPDSAGIPNEHTQDTLLVPFNDFEALESIFKNNADIAALILEPYMANCGLILPHSGFLKKVRQLCTQYKTVLIFDEVITGFRVSLGGVQAKDGILPDLTTLGKIIGGGLPVGALCGKQEIMDYLAPLGPVYQAGTMSGNPLALSAGLAALELLEEYSPYSKLEANTQLIKNSILEAAHIKGISIQVPTQGSIFSIYFSPTCVHNYEEALQTHTQHFKPFFLSCLKQGLFIAPSAYEVSFISTAHTSEHIEQIAAIAYKSILSL